MSTAEQRFIAAWRKAAPELEKIQRERLTSMDQATGAELMGASEEAGTECFYSHGLARWQMWMMRLKINELLKQANQASGS